MIKKNSSAKSRKNAQHNTIKKQENTIKNIAAETISNT